MILTSVAANENVEIKVKQKETKATEITIINKALSTAFDIRFVFNRNTFGDDFCKNSLGFNEYELNNPNFDMLSSIGFSDKEIESTNTFVCGAMTLEGAPDLNTSHLPVFDCANSVSYTHLTLPTIREV